MLQIAVFNSEQHFQRNCDSLTLSICANPSSDEKLANHISITDESVSDLDLSVELITDQHNHKLKIVNTGCCVVLNNGNRLHQGMCETHECPTTIFFGDTQVEISSTSAVTNHDDCLKQMPIFGTKTASIDFATEHNQQLSPAPATLNSWFESLSQIQRSSASQSQFFKLAARAVFNPGGLDGCIVLKRIDNDWQIVSQHLPYPEYGISYRSDLVARSVEEQSVLYHSTIQNVDQTPMELQSAVVCPVPDENGEITAVVYGFRCNNRRNNRRGIRGLEAKFVSLIADAISAGMIRLSHEANGARRRVLLQQAFSSRVAEQLEKNPDFPTVENREVSVLFADIRRFCAITEKLGCHLTYHLLSDVMDCFTQIIHQHDGVVIDYYGDGISAFWNAPVDIPNHPQLACQAGFAIVASLEKLNAKWMKEIGQQLKVGVGVATGNAQIGNSGSSMRLKYGPQGITVNIASRLEQATKKLGVNFLVSGATAERVQNAFTGNRVCTANFAGIKTPIDVVQLNALDSEKNNFVAEYQTALSLFENQKYLESVDVLLELTKQDCEQGIIEFLLSESVARMTSEQAMKIPDALRIQLDSDVPEQAAITGTVTL